MVPPCYILHGKVLEIQAGRLIYSGHYIIDYHRPPAISWTQWTRPTNQEWLWYQSFLKEVFHLDHQTRTWYVYHPLSRQSRQITCSSTYLYKEREECAPPDINCLLPTTIHMRSDKVFTAKSGPPQFYKFQLQFLAYLYGTCPTSITMEKHPAFLSATHWADCP